jgi:hypothetical protein
MQSTYNRSKTDIRATAQILSHVTCLQQNRVKVHKTEVTCHTTLGLTSQIMLLFGSNAIKSSYQAQDLSSRGVS